MLIAAPLAAEPATQYVPAEGTLSLLWLLIALPVVGATILLLGGRRTNSWGPYLACAMTGAAFVYGLIAFFDLKSLSDRSVDLHLYSWIPVNSFQVDMGLLF